jgi:hypothetical protein
MPTACPQCGAQIAPGRRFCTSCGFSLTGAPAAAAAAPARAAGAGLKSLAPLQMGVLGGLAAAAVGTILDWAKFGPIGINAWNGDARFQIADWLSMTAPIDAIVILALAAGGAYLLLAPLAGMTPVKIPYGAVGAGAAVAIVGILNFLYINDLGGAADFGISIDPGIGLFLAIGGGAAAAVCAFLDSQGTLAAR